jgi:hypothetical protein
MVDEEREKTKNMYIKAYDDAAKDLTGANLEHYIKGYTSGYRDGYQAAMESIKLLMTPEMQQRMIDDDAKLAWPPRW